MIPFHKSIGFRLLGISVILLALPLLVDSFVLVTSRYKNTIEAAKSHLIEMANLREIPLSQLHPMSHPLMAILIRYLHLESDFPQKDTQELNEKLKDLAKAGEFYVVDLIKITPEEKYIVVASGNPRFIGVDYTDFFRLNQLTNPSTIDKNYKSYIAFDEKTLEPYFIASHTVFADDGTLLGMIVILDDITSKLKELLKTDTQKFPVNFALLLPSTIVFAASDPSLNLNYFLPLNESYSQLFQKSEPFLAEHLPSSPLPIIDRIGFPFFEFMWKDEQQIGYITRLLDANYSLLAYASKNDVLQAPLIDFFNIYGVYGLILIIGGALSALATLRMSKPIQNLSLVMHKIQEGQLDLRYQSDPLGFEINALGNIFNEMVDAVIEQKHQAEGDRLKREVFARELKLGRQAQRRLLPERMPQYTGVEVAEMYIPAIEVAGDFFDVFIKESTNSKLALAVADGSGKGVRACFYSLMVRNLLRTFAQSYDDIAKAMSETNDLFCKDTADTGMFVTVLAGLYDSQTRNLSYYSCGHNPGYVRRADGTLETFPIQGVAMGLIPLENPKARELQLNVGDMVVFYTDGVIDALDENGYFFGNKRLETCIQSAENQTSAELIQTIVKQVEHFVGKAPQHDDITLLVMKITQ